MALLGTIPVQDLGPALQQLNIPDKLCHILLFTYRYIFVIHQEYTTMRQAMRARGFKPRTDTHTYRSYAWLVGMLLVRSWDRAERRARRHALPGISRTFLFTGPLQNTVRRPRIPCRMPSLHGVHHLPRMHQQGGAMSHAVIELNDISYAFPNQGKTLDGLSFHLHQGRKTRPVRSQRGWQVHHAPRAHGADHAGQRPGKTLRHPPRPTPSHSSRAGPAENRLPVPELRRPAFLPHGA